MKNPMEIGFDKPFKIAKPEKKRLMYAIIRPPVFKSKQQQDSTIKCLSYAIITWKKKIHN